MNSPATPGPVIWLLVGNKLGDNAQITMLANSLGLAFETRKLTPKPAFMRGKPRFKPSLDHLDLANSDRLQPPWPDLIITSGRRHAMAALWIKQQSPSTKIVLLGRPRRWIERFDLVISPPQYRLPALDNVLPLAFPLLRPDETAIDAAGRQWSQQTSSLQKPVTAVLIGGPTQPYRFDGEIAGKLVAACVAATGNRGDSLYFVTSPRTTATIIAALEENLPANASLYRWQKDDAGNPYQALLGLADRFIVSGDSVSMMIEVAALGKPLAIYPLPKHLRGRLWQAFNRCLSSRRIGKLLYNKGISGFPRDLSEIHHSLIDRGLARYLPDGFAAPGVPLPCELAAIRERILALL